MINKSEDLEKKKGLSKEGKIFFFKKKWRIDIYYIPRSVRLVDI
jgi:hypothetical protein